MILDKNANTIQTKYYSTIGAKSNINDIVIENNSIICTGITNSASLDSSKIFTLSLNDTCEINSYYAIDNNPYVTGGFGIAPTSDNNYIVGGYSLLYTPNYDPWVAYAAKTTATGEVLWQHRYSVDFDTTKLSYIYQILAIPQSSDVFYFGVCDVVSDVNPTQGDIFMARADSSGTILWKQKIQF
ncbi:MAG: hypothetical protein IPL33_21735 [Sphingobacteriales bacterium]|nr:hypothetical protein [Sphingobacteriales bacterium]